MFSLTQHVDLKSFNRESSQQPFESSLLLKQSSDRQVSVQEDTLTRMIVDVQSSELEQPRCKSHFMEYFESMSVNLNDCSTLDQLNFWVCQKCEGLQSEIKNIHVKNVIIHPIDQSYIFLEVLKTFLYILKKESQTALLPYDLRDYSSLLNILQWISIEKQLNHMPRVIGGRCCIFIYSICSLVTKNEPIYDILTSLAFLVKDILCQTDSMKILEDEDTKSGHHAALLTYESFIGCLFDVFEHLKQQYELIPFIKIALKNINTTKKLDLFTSYQSDYQRIISSLYKHTQNLPLNLFQEIVPEFSELLIIYQTEIYTHDPFDKQSSSQLLNDLSIYINSFKLVWLHMHPLQDEKLNQSFYIIKRIADRVVLPNLELSNQYETMFQLISRQATTLEMSIDQS
ncbi:MAG: hypothetical protein HAW62_00560, partial [Endozoicomonadaceae bacterium]|nr:hypothetical protein [Endozoicomonadaceae bacterium]